MSRSVWLFALLLVAVLSLVAVVAVTRPVRVEPIRERNSPDSTVAAPAPVPRDAGTLDSLLDAIHLEHLMKHGR